MVTEDEWVESSPRKKIPLFSQKRKILTEYFACLRHSARPWGYDGEKKKKIWSLPFRVESSEKVLCNQ